MIVEYDELIHRKQIKPKRKNRPTEQIFLFCKENGNLVALQCTVCGEIKSLDGFAGGSILKPPTNYRCKECESLRKKEYRGYNGDIIYVYSIMFSSNCIYIGQTKGLNGRISTHISDLRRGNHCDKILSLYNEKPEYVIECIKNHKVLKTFSISTDKAIVDEYEYELQIDLHKKGFEVLGRQSIDVKFLQYLIKTKRITNIFDCIV